MKREKAIKTIGKAMVMENENPISSLELENISNDNKYLLKYLNSSQTNNFHSLLFELTHNSYSEKEAEVLWRKITNHKNHLKSVLNREVGVLVAALDYLYNIEDSIEQPAIVDKEQFEAINTLVTTDGLTGLLIRRVFDVLLNIELEKAHREKVPLCLLMLDIDDFKKINDTYGHQEGDKVLKTIGQIILKNVRKYDIATRYGGEEISIIMPKIQNKTAYQIANRIRNNINKEFTKIIVTVSIGISTLRDNDNPSSIVERADSLLYSAKENGKNQVLMEE